jgi:hydroxymethylglutaryl-CoA lyase
MLMIYLKKYELQKKYHICCQMLPLTAITIREKAVERAIQAKLEGYGPDRILLMVSTSESHHIKNSGLSLKEYWKMAETQIKKAHDAGN